MSDLSERLAALSPERRRLLELRLRKSGLTLPVVAQIPRRAGAGPSPLSFAQERLWFLDQFEPESPVYNVALAFRLSGALNVQGLEQSLSKVVSRHEALRTIFPAVDGQPRQVVVPPQTTSLQVVDLQEFPNASREAKALELLSQEASRPFDLAHGPVLRGALIRLQPAEHILFLGMHHIVSDAWSTAVFLRELAAFYKAFINNTPAPLPELPLQYPDYAVWQRQWLQGEILETQLSYWKEKLSGAPPSPLPPTDYRRPPWQAYDGRRESLLLLSTAGLERLKTLGRKQDATLFMTLLTVFKVLLHRYTQQEDVVLGSPVTNRNRVELQDLIGFFLNTVVLRSDLSGDPTFLEVLARVRQVALGAFDHQDLPFEKLVAELEPERQPSHSPLFQVLFVQQAGIRQEPEFSGIVLTPLRVPNQTAKFDLTLFTREEQEGLRGTLEYNPNLFAPATMQRLLSHLRTLLQGILDHPNTPISRLPVLSQAERHQLLVEWNSTCVELPANRCVHHLFESQVERNPDAVAVQFEGRHLTYGQLNARANQLAHFLQERNIGPEMLVGICIECSLEMVVGVLGILKAGAGYLPLDPNLPVERQEFMLKDAGVEILLAQRRLLSSLPKAPTTPILLDADWETIAKLSTENPDSDVTAENLAYVLYTSGSTGVPKGVAMHHRPLHNLIQWQIQNSALPNGVRMLQFSPLSFDASFVDIFWTCCSGGTLLMVAPELRRDAESLLGFLADESVERINLPAIALQQLAEAAVDGARLSATLGEIVATAEQLQITPAVASLLDRLPDATLQNQYGPTESHVVTAYMLDGARDQWPALPPIGRPIANTQIYLLDATLEPVPIGVSGNLYIGGDGLSRGYLNRPGLTAERFIPDPFSAVPGARLYSTGDLGRFLPDGNIEYLGRSDRQVKVRGYRVEPGEIETVLRQHPSIQHAIAMVHHDPVPSSQRLVAFVVPRRGSVPDIGRLRDYLNARLPEYMVPSAFTVLDDLPLTPSGKVDRSALPMPEWSRQALEIEYVAPRTPLEKALSLIWGQVLGIERIGIYDNFFELGGHSLLATQTISRIRDILRIEVPLRTLFEAPTIAEMSQAIISHEAESGQIEKIAQLWKRIESAPPDEMAKMLKDH
jgi:amino acid adenylation domain-containing protein